jgi:large subunit ribosomal protein L5
MSRLKETYQTDLMPALTKEFSYTSPMEVPRLEKIVLNMGLGEAIQNIKVLDAAMEELTLFQVERGHAHRLHGNPPKRNDVRVL